MHEIDNPASQCAISDNWWQNCTRLYHRGAYIVIGCNILDSGVVKEGRLFAWLKERV